MLNNRLKRLVQSTGKTQLDVARDLNFTQQRFNFYVSGKRQPDNETLAQLADYFNVTTDFLLGRDADPQKNMHLSKTDRRILDLIQDTPELGEVILDIVTALESYSQEEADALLAFLKARKKP